MRLSYIYILCAMVLPWHFVTRAPFPRFLKIFLLKIWKLLKFLKKLLEGIGFQNGNFKHFANLDILLEHFQSFENFENQVFLCKYCTLSNFFMIQIIFKIYLIISNLLKLGTFPQKMQNLYTTDINIKVLKLIAFFYSICATSDDYSHDLSDYRATQMNRLEIILLYQLLIHFLRCQFFRSPN